MTASGQFLGELYPASDPTYDGRATVPAVWDEQVFHGVNGGDYRAGFATSQTAYETAFDALFDSLAPAER
jgi:glutathionyl-hydroquinone reductase